MSGIKRKNQLQVTSELLVNLSSAFFGYILFLPYVNLDIYVFLRSMLFGFAFYYFAVKIRNINI